MLPVMKLNSGIVFPAIALCSTLIVALGGCAQQEDPYVPTKRAGFRPRTTPLMQDDFGAVDPLAVPSGAANEEYPRTGGFAGSNSAPLSPLPDPAPAPIPPPPVPVPPQPPSPAPPPPQPQPKQSAPEYAKRVPGKPNWIKSPYDGTILDATDQNGVRFPPGTEVKDPKGRIMLVP
jgi:hypothetical protein